GGGGGWVGPGAAGRGRDGIWRLVFADAWGLPEGGGIGDIVQRWTGVRSGLAAGPPREDAEPRLFADLDPETRAWALDRYTLHPTGIYTEPVKLDSFWSQKWRAGVVWGRRAQKPGEARHRRAAGHTRGERRARATRRTPHID